MEKKYCMYIRKSRMDIEAEARGEGDTFARHEMMLWELSRRLTLPIGAVYKELCSGETIAARPVMQQVLAEIEQGMWAGTLVVEVERLARGDTMDQGLVAQTYKYSNAKIVTPLKIYDPNDPFDEEYFEYGLFMSRREYKTINRRLQNGRVISAKQGKYVGNVPPYGYNIVKLKNQKGNTLDIHPEQGPVVELMYQLYTKGLPKKDGSFERLGVCAIATYLNNLNIPAPKGGIWTYPSVRSILMNPIYDSMIRWGSRAQVKQMEDGEIKKTRPRAKDGAYGLYQGLHPRLVDHDTWELAQKIRKHHAPKVKKNGEIRNPLSGLVICGFCGHRMTRKPMGKKHFESLLCPIPGCKNVSSELHRVENKVMQALQAYLHDCKIKWDTINTAPPVNTELKIKEKSLKTINKEIKKLETQMSSLHDLLEQGVYTTDVFLSRSLSIGDRLQQLKKEKVTLEEGIKYEKEKEENRKTIIPRIEKVLESYWATDDIATKNELLKSVLQKIVYIKHKGGRWHDPEDFELRIYPIVSN